MSNNKCQSKLGPANCGNPNCPEHHLYSPKFSVPASFAMQASLREIPKVPFGAWTNKDTVLFKTIHGSKLYGLDHANSDDDFFIVTPTEDVAKLGRQDLRKRNQAKQTIIGNNDSLFMDFKTFVRLAGEGVPQALETMYSRKSKSDFFEEYRQNYFCSDPAVIRRYMKTIKSFSMTEVQPFKRRRHSLRLAINLEEILYTGRFNPTLSNENVSRITRYANLPDSKFFTALEQICPVEVDWREKFIINNPE